MRTNIDIDDSLINQAIRLSKLKTKREVVREVLKNYVTYMKKRELLSLKAVLSGKVR
jgi:Arc/MetJ family transcription regulator